MTLDDEIRAITNPDQPPVVYAIERHASRRGRTWTIDMVTVTPTLVRLRLLAAEAGFPAGEDGNVIRERQVPAGDVGYEFRPMWKAMKAVAANSSPLPAAHVDALLSTIEPRWL